MNSDRAQRPDQNPARGRNGRPLPVDRKRLGTSRFNRNVLFDNLSLAEDARMELAVIPAKTPVAILQEFLSKRGRTPRYELVQIDGTIHQPIFQFRVVLGDLAAIGTGRSKKEAKHAAAEKMLEKLLGYNVREEASTSNARESSNQILRGYDDKISGNPIGTLQEMCMSRRWPPPVYEMAGEEGPPHERQFTMTCVLLSYKEMGMGKSKKLAKRHAANKMWEKLQQCPPDPVGIANETGPGIASASARYANLRNSRISALTTALSHRISSFHRSLRQSTGPKLEQLYNISLHNEEFNFVQFLKEIAAEQKFEVTYVDIEEKSINGKSQCLVQLSTFPVAVCHGSGDTSVQAQTAAAQNALDYLRIMTRSLNFN